MLARVRLTSHPSPVLRAKALADHFDHDARLLERELAVFRQERERIPAKQRPHSTPAHRLEILKIMQLRDWSATQTARRFVLHPNSVRHWLKQLRTAGKSGHLFTAPVWNRIHDAVRWTVHELRRLCPEPEIGTRTIARHTVRAAIQISRSSVQRILREERPKRRDSKASIVPPEGVEPCHLLAPRTTNRVWQADMMQLRILCLRFTLAAVMDGFSRRLLRLRIFEGTPNTDDMVRLVSLAVQSIGKPRFIITDHGRQFADRFTAIFEEE